MSYTETGDHDSISFLNSDSVAVGVATAALCGQQYCFKYMNMNIYIYIYIF